MIWNWLRNVLVLLAKADPAIMTAAGPEPMEFESPDTPNPYLTAQQAANVFEHLTTWLNALWPVIEASCRATIPLQIGQAGIASILDVFTADDAEAQRGVMFELVRLARTFLPGKTDGEDMPGPRYKEEAGEGVIDIRPELAAFFDAAFQDEWTRAVQVSDAARKRAVTVFENLEPQVAGTVGVQFFASSVLVNISREFSLQNTAQYLDV